jgi:hypothetical protein
MRISGLICRLHGVGCGWWTSTSLISLIILDIALKYPYSVLKRLARRTAISMSEVISILCKQERRCIVTIHSSLFSFLQDCFDHLVSQPCSFREPRLEVLLDLLELLAVSVKVAETHAGTPVLQRGQLIDFLFRTRERGERLTLAANVNSRSSARNVLSAMAVSIHSSNSSGLRKRYSVMPNHILNNYTHHISIPFPLVVGTLTGVEQII